MDWFYSNIIIIYSYGDYDKSNKRKGLKGKNNKFNCESECECCKKGREIKIGL